MNSMAQHLRCSIVPCLFFWYKGRPIWLNTHTRTHIYTLTEYIYAYNGRSWRASTRKWNIVLRTEWPSIWRVLPCPTVATLKLQRKILSPLIAQALPPHTFYLPARSPHKMFQHCTLLWDMMTSSNGNIFRVTVTRNFDVYFHLRPNNRLSKQSWGWLFETQSRPLWRHRNVLRAPTD